MATHAAVESRHDGDEKRGLQTTRREGHSRGVRLGRIAGIELIADWSLLIIFSIVLL